MPCPPGKSMIFYKNETEKIQLVARPGGPLPRRCDPCPPLRPEKNQGAIYPGKDIVEPITCKHLFFRIWHHRYLCYVPQLK